ncbi:MAG: ribokinase [Saprospiraceae bacterium]
MLSGIDTNSDQGLEQACDVMLAKGVDMLLVTLGSDGVMLAAETGTTSFAAFKVEVVDTTAAGDVFS